MKLIKIIGSAALVAMLIHIIDLSPSDDSIKSRVVKVMGKSGMCSGEQIQAPSGESYVLTAGHCKHLADAEGNYDIVDSEGNHILRKVIAEDPNSDLLLIQGLPGVKGLEVAESSYPSQAVRTFTHGKNMNTYKTEGELIQKARVQILQSIIENAEQEQNCVSAPKYKVSHMQTLFGDIPACMMDIEEVASTARIVPGSSGGPAVDSSGRLVGVASCTDDNFFYFVKLSDIQEFLKGY